jgi:hypothetical protein
MYKDGVKSTLDIKIFFLEEYIKNLNNISSNLKSINTDSLKQVDKIFAKIRL